MRKAILILVLALPMVLQVNSALAYWIWTPETGRWINPKDEAKGTPEEQMALVKTLYETKDYDRSVREAIKLFKAYPDSKEAPEAQFYIAKCEEGLGRYYRAFLAYQKVLDEYPQSERVKDVIEREYYLGNLFFSGRDKKIAGITFAAPAERAMEIFQKVLSNEPFGKYSDLSQYKIGLCYVKQGKYTDAKLEFEKLIEQYPHSSLVDDAKFQSALCSYKSALKPMYDNESIDEALKLFKELLQSHPDMDSETLREVRKMTEELEERNAQKLFQIAKFYEKQRKIDSAVIYYQEILKKYPDSPTTANAIERLRAFGKLPSELEREQVE
ncbi:MAG: outer membrane protein assembly factor BamD [Candidatus Omnitrophica bacterium]|nr:outer membrane protein assembly factor BamD [Candidatus Omnitrophota bacterium]